MRPRVIALSMPFRGHMQELEQGRLLLGREGESTMRLMDASVSRRHFAIEQSGDGFEVVDLESRNGTFVNGVPVSRKAVRHGDTIRAGRCELMFLTEDDAPGEATVMIKSEPAVATAFKTISLRGMAADPSHGAEVGRMARDLTAFFRICEVINSIRDTRLLQHELLRLIFEVVPAEDGAVLLVDSVDDLRESGPGPSAVCTWNRRLGEDQSFEMEGELVRKALWERSAIVTEAVADKTGAANLLCVPLTAVERTIGAIYLTAPAGTPFQEDAVHFLGAVSRIAAVTLENVLALDGLRLENRRLRAEVEPASTIVGESPQLTQVERFVAKVAHSETTVLIRGESGTGKEVVARAIHNSGPRCERPFVAINCAAIPETLLESELFGHERGAFTGAAAMRKGRLEAAEDGTVFLDEIGELAPAMQAKLLRVLQQREFERLGGNHAVPLRARVLAATNQDLEERIKTGEFRQDLYYRLNVVSVTVPPLREHREDIPLLALHFAAKFSARGGRAFKGISREARRLLLGYRWPGNVRELENAIEHAIVLGVTDEILPEDLPAAVLEGKGEASGEETTGAKYHDVLNRTKRELIRTALKESRGSFPEAARLLGVHPKYLHRLVSNLNLRGKVQEDED